MSGNVTHGRSRATKASFTEGDGSPRIRERGPQGPGPREPTNEAAVGPHRCSLETSPRGHQATNSRCRGPVSRAWLAGGTQVWESHIQTPLASASQSVGPCPLLFHCPCRHAKLYVPATAARAVLTPEEEGSVVLHLTRTL